MADAPPLVVVAGATATGKTELGIRLAEALLAEGRPATVISADSRQVYRGLDIGTAKVSAADRARVPHAGLDLVDPPERFALADFVAHARGVLAEVAAQDGVALLVGGTGLYLRAVARGIDLDALPDDPAAPAPSRGGARRRGPGAPGRPTRGHGPDPCRPDRHRQPAPRAPCPRDRRAPRRRPAPGPARLRRAGDLDRPDPGPRGARAPHRGPGTASSSTDGLVRGSRGPAGALRPGPARLLGHRLPARPGTSPTDA